MKTSNEGTLPGLRTPPKPTKPKLKVLMKLRSPTCALQLLRFQRLWRRSVSFRRLKTFRRSQTGSLGKKNLIQFHSTSRSSLGLHRLLCSLRSLRSKTPACFKSHPSSFTCILLSHTFRLASKATLFFYWASFYFPIPPLLLQNVSLFSHLLSFHPPTCSVLRLEIG